MNEDLKKELEQKIDQGIEQGGKVKDIIDNLQLTLPKPEVNLKVNKVEVLELVQAKYNKTHSQEIREIADLLYESWAIPHPSCENDLFYLAHKFDLDPEKKKESALRLIINGMVGYFEPKTHHGLNVEMLLSDLGVKIHYPECHYMGYTFLLTCSIRRIASKFGITNEELADCAYIACEFGLGKEQSFQKSRAENRDAVGGSTPISLSKVQDLEFLVLS